MVETPHLKPIIKPHKLHNKYNPLGSAVGVAEQTTTSQEKHHIKNSQSNPLSVTKKVTNQSLNNIH